LLDTTETTGHQRVTSRGADDYVTVVIAGEEFVVRARVRHALEHHGFSVVAAASDADEAVAAALEHRPRLCLLELGLPGDGIAAIEAISSELPDTRIATLSDAISDEDAFRAIRAGADGLLLKATAPDRLTAALAAMARGETALPRSLTGRLVEELRLRDAPLRAPARGASVGSRLLYGPLYVPRFMRHLRRRMRADMRFGVAWGSARARVREYR
jgi:DNA-binding NarL/FixJ family response regulator